MNHLNPATYGLNCTTTVLQGWFWHSSIHGNWYAIKNEETKGEFMQQNKSNKQVNKTSEKILCPIITC